PRSSAQVSPRPGGPREPPWPVPRSEVVRGRRLEARRALRAGGLVVRHLVDSGVADLAPGAAIAVPALPAGVLQVLPRCPGAAAPCRVVRCMSIPNDREVGVNRVLAGCCVRRVGALGAVDDRVRALARDLAPRQHLVALMLVVRDGSSTVVMVELDRDPLPI